jgi:hypothetical protein
MLPDASSAVKRWNDAAEEIAPLLEDRTCIVILAEHDDDAAYLAIALARTEGGTRRVAIVDAVGELAPIQKLLPKDAEPHGVIDHFLHGVSLRKIAYPVNRKRTIFVLPSGAGPFEYETLLRRERWRRLTMAFRSEDALLCVLLPSNAAGLPAFVEDTDGVVLVDDVEYPESRHVVAVVRSAGHVSADVSMLTPASRFPMATLLRWAREAISRRWVAIAVAGVVAAVAALFAWNSGAGNAVTSANRAGAQAHSSTEAGRAGAIAEDDSAGAAMYSIDVVMLNSLGDATRQLTDRLGNLPAATFAPMLLGADSARWYRLLVGAWPEQRQAEAALATLRDAGVLESGFGSVRRTPFAVRIEEDLSVSEATARARELRAAGLPAYALQRDEDHAVVYAGAFETPSQAMPLLDMFQRAGIDATIAYRIGRGI